MSTTQLIRVRAGHVEAAAAVALYGMYEPSAAWRRGLDGCLRPHGRHRHPEALPRDLLGARYPNRFGLGSGPRRRPRRSLHSLHFVATTALSCGAPPPPDAFAAVRTTLVVSTGCARRLPHVPRCSATPRRPRLHGHGHEERRRQPELQLAGALYNPSRQFPASTSGYARSWAPVSRCLRRAHG
jgi:hypothetical protein